MVLGTPNSVYDTDEASRLLHDIGDDIVAIATSNLLSRGVLSKTTRTPSTRPGRALKISELYVPQIVATFVPENIPGIRMPLQALYLEILSKTL
jgi:hypothetical protein